MERLHPEITCALCRTGFGGLKRNAPGKFEHLDLCWSYDAGTIVACSNPDLLESHILMSDERQNVTFDAKFQAKLNECQNSPDRYKEIIKDNTEFDQWYYCLVACIKYEELATEDLQVDLDQVEGVELKPLYDAGKSIDEVVTSLLIPIIEKAPE